MKESVSVDQTITKTGLRYITPMLLSIDMMFHFVFNVWITFKEKPYGIQCNRLLDAVVAILKYKKITMDHAIYSKVFNYGKMSCITVSTYDVLNTTNNET